LKKSESRLYYSLRRSTPFFHEKDLKNWLEGLQNHSSPENIFLYNNLVEREKHAINSSSDLTKYFIEKLFREEYFLEPLEPKQDSKTLKEPEISGTEEKLQILGISEFESRLREKFLFGTQQDFENLAKQLDPNITQSETESLFEKLVDEGKLAMDPEGWWRWT